MSRSIKGPKKVKFQLFWPLVTLKIKFDPPKGQTWHELIHFPFNIDIIFNLRHWSPKLNDFKTFEGHPILDQLRGRQTLVNIYSVIECWASIKFTKIVTKSRVFIRMECPMSLWTRINVYYSYNETFFIKYIRHTIIQGV